MTRLALALQLSKSENTIKEHLAKLKAEGRLKRIGSDTSDTPVGISKSMGLGMIGFAEAYEELKPNIVVVLGDRFEIFCAAGAACVSV